MRRSLGPLLASLLLATLWIAGPAHAQVSTEPSAEMRLVRQTPWTTPEKPVLHLTVRVTNDGETTITDPVIGWAIGPRVTSRVQYETSLREGPSYPASADSESLPTDLGIGESELVRLSIDVGEIGSIDPEDSAVYPLHVALRSDETDLEIASLTTAAIHIVQEPQRPVLFSWWTEIAAPIMFGPKGTLVDEGFEEQLGAGLGIVAQVASLEELVREADGAAAFDVVVSPVALDQLRQIADGYEREDGERVREGAPVPTAAAATLERLRAIAADPRVRLHAMPFAAPRLPAMLTSGLRTHVDAQWRLGDDTFERLLGEPPDAAVARPPGLEFDQASVDALFARGVTTILGADDSVARPPQEFDFAPPPAASIATSAGDTMRLLLPDPGAQSLLDDPSFREDPALLSQIVLGELATIWKEQPVPPPDEVRGLALDLDPDLPSGIWRNLPGRLTNAPFLEAVNAEDLAAGVRPEPATATLQDTSTLGFSTAYADELAATASRVATFAAILDEPVPEADRLRRALMYAESSQFIGNEGSGQAWIDAVNGVIDRTFARIAPDTSRRYTFTSRSGKIPLQMGDPGDRVMNVTVELASGRVEFLDGRSRTVKLDRANQVITFDAEVKATGPSRIDVFVIAPNGSVVSRAVLVVNSTAINPIALIITAGAGLVLVGLWSRRLFRRRNP
jgi:hypothetical protein